LIESIGHEKHMVFLVGYFDRSDYFDQVLNRTFSQKGQIKKMVHQNAHRLVKLTILNGHT